MPKVFEKLTRLSGWYSFSPNYKPSQKMLDEVGLDFDDDLGGLTKHRLPGRHLSFGWVWLALAIPLIMILVNPLYGVGFISGVIYTCVGLLAYEASVYEQT